jgi:hypothetical protein
MSQYKFSEVPSNDTVASFVTLLVCAWFTAAGGAILAEPTVGEQAQGRPPHPGRHRPPGRGRPGARGSRNGHRRGEPQRQAGVVSSTA